MSQHVPLKELDGGRRRHRSPKQGHGCLAPLVALVVIVVLIAVAYVWGVGFVRDVFHHSKPQDYQGQGQGGVVVQVHHGDTSTDIATTLVKADVVASEQAFVDAAKGDQRSLGIQVGYYRLHHKMSAQAALAILVDPKNLVGTSVTIREGLRATEIVTAIAKNTGFTPKQLDTVLAKPASIGLPAAANGKVEGYLYPATYDVTPGMTPTSLLTAMVDRFKQQAAADHLTAGAAARHLTPYQVLIVASIVQAEVSHPQDMPKVSRVIYNRLARKLPLGMDSTLHYALGLRGDVQLTPAQINKSGPYNTRRKVGFPPTPIDSPGDVAIKAALHPANGSWLYFVTVNLRTGDTRFFTSYAKFCAVSPSC